MAIREATPLEVTQITDAVSHYIDCLNLSEDTSVVLITDTPSIADPSDDRKLRRAMTGLMATQLEQNGFKPVTLYFDNDMDEEKMYASTKQALESFHSIHPATIVYLGDSWTHRNGIYQAAAEESHYKKVRVAGSMGFTTGDARVMSQMTPERRELLEQTNTFFEEFFDEHPKGTFVIETLDSSGTSYYLGIPYDITQAPFISSLGMFDERTHIDADGYAYTNIPSGEKFGVPYSFEHAFGIFNAQDILFTVYDGMVEKFEATPQALAKITNRSQRELLDLVKKGKKVPVAELGLGYFSLAHIDVYTDSSPLTAEKDAHIGMGKTVSKSTEASAINELAGDYQHTDFPLKDPRVLHYDFFTKQTSQFFPPEPIE